MNCRRVSGWLPFYVNDTIDGTTRGRVDRHLAACPGCRDDLETWRAVGLTVGLAVGAGLWAEARAASRGETSAPRVLRRAWLLLASQVRLLRREVWSASLVILAVGLVVALATRGRGVVFDLVRSLAPLVAAGGVSLTCSAPPERTDVLSATPTSPRVLLLARLVLVFGGNAVVMALVALTGGAGPWRLVSDWLAPMTALSSVALLVSVLARPAWGTGTAIAIWLLRGLCRDPELRATVCFPGGLAGAAETLVRPPSAWMWSVVFLTAAVWLVGRPDRVARPRAEG